MRKEIFGIVPPMTTPFRPDDTIDEGALRNVKYCQGITGRPAGVPRAPMPATSPAQATAIQAALRGAGLLR